jgi:DNA-binding NtrC family response regulator
MVAARERHVVVTCSHSRRVLLVDDDPDILDTLEYAIGSEGFEVVKASSGEAAIEAARRGAFGAAVTDLKMPGMSGLETMAVLKTLQPALPVVVITGFATGETLDECRRLGACGFIRKPFKLEELLGLIHGALAA